MKYSKQVSCKKKKKKKIKKLPIEWHLIKLQWFYIAIVIIIIIKNIVKIMHKNYISPAYVNNIGKY